MNMKPAATALVLAVICCGCGAARPSRYYQLSAPSVVIAEQVESRYPATLVVAPLTASHLYREDRIVYSAGNEMGTYEYRRWTEPPTELFEDLLIRKLRDSGHYRGVYPQRRAAQGDYVLRGHLYDFKEMSGSNLSAKVTVELELRDTKTGSMVWTHFYTHDESIEQKKDVSAVVAALDRNAQQGIKEFVASLDQYFAAHAGK